MRSGILLLALLPLACATGPPAIPLPEINAEVAAKQAMAEYDTNRDGALDGAELEKCPPLKNSLAAFDANGDGKLTAEEIADRLRKYSEGNAGLLGMGCEVALDGKPLAGASVRLIPERFLGANLKPATGTTDAKGYARLQTEGMDVEGVQYGLFRIEVSFQGTSSQEMLPARYNSQTILGQEVSTESLLGGPGIRVELSSTP